MTDEQLSAIRAECEAATMGPFEVQIHDAGFFVVREKGVIKPLWIFTREADAVFAAHARRNVLDLLAEVESLRAALSSWDRRPNNAVHLTPAADVLSVTEA